MRTRSISFSIGILAVSAAMSASSAEACLPGSALLFGTPGCATDQANSQQACPAQSVNGNTGNDCILSRQDVSKAVGTMGNMAAGGIGIATNVMRALSDQALRMASPN